jgi:chromosome partitioning protein
MNTTISLEEAAAVLNLSPKELKNLAQSVGVTHLETGKLTPVEVRAILERRGFRFSKRNIVFHCLKGGAAKTTLAYNSAYRLSQLGARVLLIDLDKQANATQIFDANSKGFCFVDMVTGKAKAEDAIVSVAPGLDLLPSSLENARLEMELIHQRRDPRAYYRSLFESVRSRYDFMVFDLPPDLNHNTYLASVYADWIVVPVSADAFGMSGMRMTLDSIQSIQTEFQRTDQEVLVVWSKYDSREKSSHAYLEELQELGKARLLPTVIRTDVSFKQAQSKGKSVFQLRKQSNAKQDLDYLVREISGLNDAFSIPAGEA